MSHVLRSLPIAGCIVGIEQLTHRRSGEKDTVATVAAVEVLVRVMRTLSSRDRFLSLRKKFGHATAKDEWLG
jgi:hypothetical protein